MKFKQSPRCLYIYMKFKQSPRCLDSKALKVQAT